MSHWCSVGCFAAVSHNQVWYMEQQRSVFGWKIQHLFYSPDSDSVTHYVPVAESHLLFPWAAYIIPLIHLTSNCISLAMSSWILWALSVSMVPSRFQRVMMPSISVRYLQRHRDHGDLLACDMSYFFADVLLRKTSYSDHFMCTI